ncbi:MAG: GntR family transcriptional regulator [Actinomycetota bacterium]|nr:GntR family transcriptional regulator [Actinomycetota bacterium]
MAKAQGGGERSRQGRLAHRGKLRYEQVIDLVERLIVEREMEAGDLLPSAKEIGRLAGVSLMSVRRALDELERAGRVERHQGVGTFVTGERILSEPGRIGGLLATLTSGRSGAIETRLLGVTQGIASAAVTRALGIGRERPVWQISRLRRIGRRPMIVEEAIIPLHLAPSIDQQELRKGGSLYRMLAERYGLVDDYEEQFLQVTVPKEAERTLLGLSTGETVARIRGVSFTRGGIAFDCFQQAYPAHDFMFYISGQTSRHVLRGSQIRDWSVEPMATRDG